MRSWVGSNRPHALTIAAIGLVAVGVVITRLPVLGLGEIDWDEGVYWLSLQTMRAGHPLFTSVYSSQPPAFLLFTEPVWALLGGGIVAARAVMLAWCVVGVVAGGVVGWRLGGRLAAVATAVTLAVDPAMVHQSVVLQSDGPATALGLAAVALAAVAVTSAEGRTRVVFAGLAGAALAFGFLTKFLDAAVVLPLLGVLLIGRSWRLLLAAVGGGLLAAAVLLLPMHDAWSAIWSQSVGLHIDSRSNGSGTNVAGALRLHWHLAALALVGAVAGWRGQRRLVVCGVLWFFGALAAMAVTHPLWPHHTVVLSPGYAMLCAAGVATGFAWLRGVVPRDLPLLAGGGVLGLGLVAALFLWSGLRGLSPTTNFTVLAAAVRAHTFPSAQLVGDDQFAQAMAGRAAPPFYVDTSNTRLYAEKGAIPGLEAVSTGSPPVCAVLFSSGRLVLLPGYAAWVAERYPERVNLGGTRYLAIAPGCR